MVACPKCHSQDAVQKVSSIVAGGTYETTYQMPAQGQLAGHTIYGTVTEHGTGQTELARRLSIPTSKKGWEKFASERVRSAGRAFEEHHPAPKSGWARTLMWMAGVCALIGLLLGLPTACSPVAYQQVVPLVLLLWVVAFILQMAGATILQARRKEWNKARNMAMIQTRSGLIQGRSRVFSRWDRLYYCYRDDLVFLPDEDWCVPSSEMMQMLMGA
jgi:hypothetical protein